MFTHPTVFHLLLFALGYAMVSITTGFSLEGGSNPLTIVTFRSLAVVGLLYVYCRFAGVSLALSRRDLMIACGIGVALWANNYTLNEALGRIPVPLGVLIFYTWPALTTVYAWLAGKDRFSWRSLFGLALAFVGLALALNVDFTAAEMTGVWLALGSALAWSITFLLVGHFFGGRDMRAISLYMIATSALIFCVLMAITRDLVWPGGGVGWLGMLALPFFYVFASIGTFAATATMGPTRVGFYMNFEPVGALILAAIFLAHGLKPIQFAGAALVIAALFLFRPLKPEPRRH